MNVEVVPSIAAQLVKRWVEDNVPRLLLLDFEKRLSNRQVYLRAKRIRAHLRTDIIQPSTARWLRAMRLELQRGAAKAARASTPTKAAARIVDWDKLQREGEERMLGPLMQGYLYAAHAITHQGLLRKQADPMGEAAIDYSRDRTATLVTAVTMGTKDAIKLYIQMMVTLGLPATKVAVMLRPIVGLLPRHALAVGRYTTKLLDAGVPFDNAIKRATDYANKLHRYRTRMIARTESSFAQSEGIRQGYKEMGIKRLRFVSDPESCEICQDLNGQVFDIDEAEGVIPGDTHPQCECTWVAAA